jgi:isopenicillin N synthase-like dioxygenase
VKNFAPSLATIRPDAKEEIPVLDLGPFRAGTPGAKQALALELHHALEEVGFYFIVNHGIEQSLIDAGFEAARMFHDLPLEEKNAHPFTQNNTGYVPLKGSITRHSKLNENNRPNLVEAFFFKRELAADHPDVLAGVRFRGLNSWPKSIPSFREKAVAYATALEGLGKSLLPLYALALDLPENAFDEAFREPMYTLRLSHYPKQDPAQENEFGLAPHSDTSFMTLLAQNRIQGLSIRLPNGKWIDAPAMPGSFLVNGGDLLRRWSNDRLLATPHRVINRSGQERYAIPFFMDCKHDFTMTCLPTCHSADNPPKYDAMTYTEYMGWYRNANYGKPAQDDSVQLAAY